MLSTTWPRISSFPQASDIIFYPFCHRINTESKQYDSSKLLPKLEKTLESPLDCMSPRVLLHTSVTSLNSFFL